MPEIYIHISNYGGQNKKSVMIRSLIMIKEGGFFGADTLHFYIQGHTQNGCYRASNSLKVMYRNQNIFTFENSCEILNTSNNVEVVQMFHEKFFDLGSLLDDLYDRPDPKTVNINYVFKVKKESAHIGYCQQFHGRVES